MNNKSIKIIIKTSIGLTLFLWMAYSLYNQIKHQPDLKATIHQLFYEWDSRKYLLLVAVLVLMVLNWTIEAIKWKYLLKGTEEFSVWKSLQSVLTGVAVSIITPNRIGEYMGRILYLRNVHKLQGITVTIVGSFAQLIVTGFLGLVGLIYYMMNVNHTSWLNVLLISSILLCIALTYFYFNLSKLVQWTSTISFLSKLKTYIQIVKRYHTEQLIRVLVISTCRYIVYTLQLMILLKLMMVEISFFDSMFSIWLLFWAMAIVPTIAIAEIGIRGETALFFLAPLSTNHLGIISATLLLWLINLIIPALFGCLFVFKMKLYDDE